MREGNLIICDFCGRTEWEARDLGKCNTEYVVPLPGGLCQFKVQCPVCADKEVKDAVQKMFDRLRDEANLPRNDA